MKQESKVDEEVEDGDFQANQPWAELEWQGRNREGVARLGDKGGNQRQRNYGWAHRFPLCWNGLLWPYYLAAWP